jgi:tetratricopeptide (TPR) repeat protein
MESRLWLSDLDVQRLESGLANLKITELHATLEKRAVSGELPEEMVSLFRLDAADAPLALGPRSEITASGGATGLRLTPGELYNEGAYRQCRDHLVEQFPTLSVGDLHLLALCAYDTGDYEHSFDAAEKLSESEDTGAEGLYWETRSSQNLASEALAHASKIDSNSPKLHVLLGDVYRQQERFEDAEREYRKSLTLRPQDTGALFGLSLALLGNGQRDEALHVAQAAIKDNPGDPELNAVMGEVLCQREEFLEAETYLKKSLNTKPEYIPHLHALLSKVYANTNRTQEAIAELKLALPEDKNGSLYYQIGRLYLKVGDRDSAQGAFVESKRLERQGLSRGATHRGQGESGNDSQ